MILALFTSKIFLKMRMSEKCYNNNSDNPLNPRRIDGGKNEIFFFCKGALFRGKGGPPVLE